MLQASFKLLAAAWDLYCHVAQQSISLTHTHSHTYSCPGRNFLYRETSDQADTLEWLLGPDWLTVRGLRINVFARKPNSSGCFVCVRVCVCAAACVEGMLACSTSCLLIHGILILRWQRRGSEDRQAAPEQAERIRGLAWQERPLAELSRWVQETKTSACVSKHQPLSPPRGQELEII